MIAWFRQLTRREQNLIWLMIGLFIIIGTLQFVIRPVLRAHSEAELRHASAERSLKTVTQSAALLGDNQLARDRKVFGRSDLIRTAGDFGLSISRVQPQNTNDLQVWFEEASSPNVLRYIAMLEREFSVQISKLQISRREEGLVRAQLLISTGTAQ